jgi:hypothetical protein
MKWTVGLITSPRNDFNYIEETLNSFSKTGFELPVIFAEPKSIIPSSFKGHVVYRRKKFGDWTNWATGLYELLLSEPDSDYFLMLEDDVIFCSGIKDYLEYSIHKLEPFGTICLFTPSIYHKKNFKGFHNEERGHRTWCTQAVIISRDNLMHFFSDSEVNKHRFKDTFGFHESYWCCPNVDFKNSIKDAVIGRWAKKKNLPIYYHTPSLAKHIGIKSTLRDDVLSAEDGRECFDFIENFEDLEKLTKSKENVLKKIIENII